MDNKREDRRVRLTKQAIRESLIELSEIYPISKISVKMLCEHADVNRSTFYAHYKDQYDLLKQVEQSVLEDFTEDLMKSNIQQQSELFLPILVKVLEYAKENRSLVKALLSEHGDPSFMNSLMQIAQQKSLQEMSQGRQVGERAAAYLETFAISGYVSIIRKWLEDGCTETPVEVAALMTKLLFEGIMSVYE